jgi:putative transposase
MKYEKLEFGKIYHIYNRGNNGGNLFMGEDNYLYFLRLFEKYLIQIFDTYCYCLLTNHFHFLIRVKDEMEIPEDFKVKILSTKTSKVLETFEVSSCPNSFDIWRPLSNFFNAYSKAINKRFMRTGSLFQYKFKRKEITSEKYLNNLVLYIHANSEKHWYINDFRTYKYSSYQAVISNKPSNIKRDAVIGWYDDLNNLIYYHYKEVNEDSIQEMIIKN